MEIILFVVVVYIGLIIITGILRPLVFAVEPVFGIINYLQWVIVNPLRVFWKTIHNNKPRGFFLALSFTGISIIWFILTYFITIPLRIVTAIYYDIILFSAVSFSDNIQEFVNPKRGKIGHTKGYKYLLLYIGTLPYRFVVMSIDTGLYIADSILMFGVSVIFPTLTMLHGTSFREAGTKITQSGDWFVGHGNYAGTGIYFGLNKKTANHYAPSGVNKSIIIARVTLTFTKTMATLKEEDRKLVGLGGKGENLARKVKGLYSSVEHWREMGWWEYCLLYPGKRGKYISSWRIRPVALVNNDKIVRTYGGFSHYSIGSGLLAGMFAWTIILLSILAMNYANYYFFLFDDQDFQNIYLIKVNQLFYKLYYL